MHDHDKRLSALHWVVLALMAYPWLNPIAPNPSPMVVPWLFAWVCGLLAWWAIGTLAPGGVWRGASWLALWLAAWVLVVVWRSPSINGETMFTLGALALMAAAVDIGARAQQRSMLVRLVVGAWLLAAVLSSVMALCQYFDVARYFFPVMNISTQGEAFGNLRQRNQFATLANMGLACLVFFWSALRIGTRALKGTHAFGGARAPMGTAAQGVAPALAPSPWRRRFQLAAPWLALVVLMAANAASVSRTGMMGVMAITGLALLWRRHLPRRQMQLALAAPLVYWAAALVLPYLANWATGTMGNSLFIRLELAGLSSCTSRKALYFNVWELIAARPWTGWGWRELAFAHYETAYTTPRFCEILDNAHNLPLHLAVELGIPAALVLLVPLLAMTLLARPWREANPVRQLAWVVVMLLVLHSMLEYPLWYGPFILAFGLCLGLLWPGEASSPRQASAAKLRVGMLVAGLVLLCYASFSYVRMSQFFTTKEDRLTLFAPSLDGNYGPNFLYANQTNFATLVTGQLAPDNAAQRFEMASALLHYSPEPRIIEAQLDAARQLEKPATEIAAYERQYKAVYPEDYAKWTAK
jgi:O-antigen ligase